MKISVVIPTYNRAGVLAEALVSVLAQSHAAHEVIVVDDGSSDDTAAMVACEFSEVTLIRQDNHGVSHARNRGIEAATGDWIALLDSDDRWHPDKLARQCEALRVSPGHRLVHCDEIWIRHGVRVNAMRKHAKQGGWIFEHCLPLCAISPSAAMLHRSVFDDVGLFDESLPACEDYDYWLRLTAREPVLFVEQALLTKYGGHEDQLSRKYWGMDRFRIRALDKILRSGGLDEKQFEAARAMLLDKIRVYIKGAMKRGKQQEVAEYGELAAHYGEFSLGS